ncbi:MAG: hypothetical protein GTO40_14845, partial [Deltaproteobacteria bacterium]|nr:hypothetical protein [Deltaproteobacteria bacterium]
DISAFQRSKTFADTNQTSIAAEVIYTY